MEQENLIQSQETQSSNTPQRKPAVMHADSVTSYMAATGCIIPNRIFVGRIDHRVNLRDLRLLFSQHGVVREVKIVTDRAGMSKGYGFVTFESHEDALRVLSRATGICLRGRRLRIGQAIQKPRLPAHLRTSFLAFPEPAVPQQVSWGSLLFSSYDGGYFHCPNASPPAPHWPPVYQQPAYQPFQQCQWDAVQLPPSAVMYPLQPKYFYPAADGVSAQPPASATEDMSTEYAELSVQPPYEAATPYVLQHDLAKPPHRSRHFLPDAPELASASAFYFL